MIEVTIECGKLKLFRGLFNATSLGFVEGHLCQFPPIENRVDNGVHQAESISFFGIDKLTTGNQQFGAGDADQATGALGAAETGVDTYAGFREGQYRLACADAIIAGQGQFQPATKCQSIEISISGLVGCTDFVQHLLAEFGKSLNPRQVVSVYGVDKKFDIGAGDKGLAFAVNENFTVSLQALRSSIQRLS